MEKDISIIEAVTALKARFGETLEVADHWDGDVMATGVAARDRPDRLVYFCTFQRGPGRYYVDLESSAPVGSRLPYEQGETFDDVDFASSPISSVDTSASCTAEEAWRRHDSPLQSDGRVGRFAPSCVRRQRQYR